MSKHTKKHPHYQVGERFKLKPTADISEPCLLAEVTRPVAYSNPQAYAIIYEVKTLGGAISKVRDIVNESRMLKIHIPATRSYSEILKNPAGDQHEPK